MTEIERKFLVKSMDFKRSCISSNRIIQGFLSTHPERTVRVRIKNNTGYLTIKGISNSSGTTRYEWEKEIPVADAEELFALCEGKVVEKTRYEVKEGSHLFEVDEFEGLNAGLIIAEVELKSEDEAYNKPNWLGKEVTGDTRYYNSQLSKQPFKNWES